MFTHLRCLVELTLIKAMKMEFYTVEPTLENYWRAIILFGKNVASYKFALAKSLYDLKASPNDIISLEELAVPFSGHLCEHLKHSPKQITSRSSKYLDACLAFNNQQIELDELIDHTVKLGFNNVIDAFHIVNSGEIDKRFFIDERKQSRGIRITDNFFNLAELNHFASFELETEARWRLVEEAWRLGISRSLVTVHYDSDEQFLFTKGSNRRVNLSSCRDSLNGYQKGRCFYCFRPISINDSESDDYADVDHFIPKKEGDKVRNIDGVWNLVLACSHCNRGHNGKFAKLPSINLLQRLHKRNEYFINSHLPLKETLILQTGNTVLARQQFLQKNYNQVRQTLLHMWEPIIMGEAIF